MGLRPITPNSLAPCLVRVLGFGSEAFRSRVLKSECMFDGRWCRVEVGLMPITNSPLVLATAADQKPSSNKHVLLLVRIARCVNQQAWCNTSVA